MLTDIEIAQQTKLIPIDQLAHEYGLSDDQFIPYGLSLIHISEPTRLLSISYAVFCLK